MKCMAYRILFCFYFGCLPFLRLHCLRSTHNKMRSPDIVGRFEHLIDDNFVICLQLSCQIFAKIMGGSEGKQKPSKFTGFWLCEKCEWCQHCMDFRRKARLWTLLITVIACRHSIGRKLWASVVRQQKSVKHIFSAWNEFDFWHSTVAADEVFAVKYAMYTENKIGIEAINQIQLKRRSLPRQS